jgi:hypothetical protein
MKLPHFLTASPRGHRSTSALARWVVAGLCLGIGFTVGAATQTTVDPATLSALREAEIRMDQLAGLERQAKQTREKAQSFGGDGEAAASAWENYRQADEKAHAVIQRGTDCLSGLKIELSASETAIATLERLLARSHSAVKTVAQASADELALAARTADVAFRQRSESEQALASQQRRLKDGALECASLTSEANRSASEAKRSAQRFVQQAETLPSQLQTLRTHWLATTRAFSAAKGAKLLNHRAPRLVLPEGEHIRRLEQALSSLNIPMRRPIADPNVPRAFGQEAENLERSFTDLARLEDAATYIDLVAGPEADPCQGDACLSFAVERRELAQRRSDALKTYAETRRGMADLAASLDGLLQPLHDSLRVNARALTPVAAALGPAVYEVVTASRTVQEAAESLQREANTGYRQARREWEAAYRLAYGHAPVELADSTSTRRPVEASGARGAAMGKRRPNVRSHAYELFNTWDAEPKRFGAYTYVLLRSGSDLETPAVSRRFHQLLSTLKKLPEARLVAPEQAQHVNVFCIPGSPVAGTEGRPSEEVVYASDLGQQIKLRAQNGLLTRKEVSQRLTSSAGPFLITLPSRIVDAPSSSPLLFADLSGYPDEAIADLVNLYMNGLVDDFPRQQALWKPPVLQRVALFMIHLASGAGEMVTSVMPTAAAKSP